MYLVEQLKIKINVCGRPLSFGTKPTLLQQFGENPFLFLHDSALMRKAKSIEKWFSEFTAGELD